MPYPRKAVVLAAGLGTRMQPITNITPKPLIPFWGIPLLSRTLQQLASWKVRDVLVNVHHRADEVIDTLRKENFPGLRVQISYEPEILGTGGVLRRAEWFVSHEPFWMVNSDIVLDLNPAQIIREFYQRDALATLWMHSKRGPRTVELKADGRIHTFRSKKAGKTGTFTFCGLQLIHPRILKYIPPEEKQSSIIAAYERAQRKGEKVVGVERPDSFWADVGTPVQYLEAHLSFKPKTVPKNSGVRTQHRSVLMNDARLVKGARFKDAIAGPGAVIWRSMSGVAVPADAYLTSVELEALDLKAHLRRDATVEILPARGSARNYARIHWKTGTLIHCRYSPSREENLLNAGHSRILHRAGIGVPELIHDNPKHLFSFIEDVGSLDLEHHITRLASAKTIQVYKDVLSCVAHFHGDGTRAVRKARRKLMPSFSTKLFRWEHELFINEFSVPMRLIRAPETETLLKELTSISRKLSREPGVLIHRDLQSSNILLSPKGIRLIDFQGMRFGPTSYDLASLISDPYVCLNRSVQRELLNYYVEETGYRFATNFSVAAVQRLAQALGAFGRLSRVPGCERFERYIAPALKLLNEHASSAGGLPTLEKVVERALTIYSGSASTTDL